MKVLGIEMNSINDRKGYKMTHDGMINNTIKTCNMEDFKSSTNTTALLAPLGKYYFVKETNLKD